MEQNGKFSTIKVSLRSILSMLLFQSLFYGILFVLIYWIVTLNYTMLMISLIISVAQMGVKQEKSQRYKYFVLHYLRPQDYFFIERFYEESIPEDEKTMFTVHPHSIFCYGLLANLNEITYPNQKFTNATPLGSRFVLSLPLIGLHFKLWGFQSVSPSHLSRLMGQGKSITLVPGGYEQATITTPKQLRLFIKQRKGFIKYALKYGYTVRPVIITNEHKAMQTLDIFTKLRLLINKIKIPSVIYWNIKFGILFPPGVVMNTIVGKGVKGSKIYGKEEPTHQEINQMHAQYIEEVKRMYEKNKSKNGNTPLTIY